MADIIREVYLMFEKHLGKNMREWPEGSQDLMKDLMKHVSDAKKDAYFQGFQNGETEVISRLKVFLKN